VVGCSQSCRIEQGFHRWADKKDWRGCLRNSKQFEIIKNCITVRNCLKYAQWINISFYFIFFDHNMYLLCIFANLYSPLNFKPKLENLWLVCSLGPDINSNYGSLLILISLQFTKHYCLKYHIQTHLDQLEASRQTLLDRILEIDQTMANPKEEDIERVRHCWICQAIDDGPTCVHCELEESFQVCYSTACLLWCLTI